MLKKFLIYYIAALLTLPSLSFAGGMLTREEQKEILAQPGMQILEKHIRVNTENTKDIAKLRSIILTNYDSGNFASVIKYKDYFKDDALINYLVGVSYYLVTPQELDSKENSLKYIKISAKQGNPYALWSLGSEKRCQSWGICDQDLDHYKEQARKKWQEEMNQENANSTFFYGLTLDSWTNYIPFYSRNEQNKYILDAAMKGSISAINEYFSRNSSKIEKKMKAHLAI